MTKVSVIVPVYNGAATIKRCLDSLIGQTYENIEIIVIDDGSDDASPKICDNYANSDKRIKVIHQKNRGVSCTRNNGIQNATGDYIMFLDGDDAIDKNAIEICVKHTDKGFWDVVTFGYHMYLETKSEIKKQNDIVYQADELKNREEIKKSFVDSCKKGLFDFVTDKMIRASLIRENDLKFKSEFNIGGEDAVFIMDLLPFVSNIKITSHAFYQYFRRENESMTQIFHPNKFNVYIRRVCLLSDLMLSLDCFDSEYLTLLCGTYFLWSYESMFLNSCNMSIKERMDYIIHTYFVPNVFSDKKSEIRKVCKNKKLFENYCKTSRTAMVLFYNGHVHMLALWHILTILKGNNK